MSFKSKEEHWRIITDYMLENPDFCRGRLNTAQARKDYQKMWIELTDKLNSVGLGYRTVEKWQKAWSDFKQNLKKKAAEIDKSSKITGGGPNIEKSLSEFDLRVLSILGNSFYKGVGVQEMGIPVPHHATTAIVKDSLNFNVTPAEPGPSKRSSAEQTDMQNLKVPFRTPGSNNVSLPRQSDTMREDHDYLAAWPKRKRRKGDNSHEIEEEMNNIYKDTVLKLDLINNNIEKIAASIGNVANSLTDLTKEVRLLRLTMENK